MTVRRTNLVTRRETFNHLNAWLEDVQQHGNDKIQTILVASKLDLDAKREVSTAEGEKFAKEHQLLYIVNAPLMKGSICKDRTECRGYISSSIHFNIPNFESISRFRTVFRS
jgi:GTPase SAR1 family protein